MSRGKHLRLNNGQLDAVFDDAGADRISCKSGSIVDVEFLHQMFAMFLDRFHTDAEIGSGFLIGFAFGDQLQHFHFARGQLNRPFVKLPGAIKQS